MKPKNERTIDYYKFVGANFRLLKELATMCYVEGLAVVPKHERHVMLTMLNKARSACDLAEASMWGDHPGLSEEYTAVFDGCTHKKPFGEIDKEVIEIARKIADNLVWRDKDGEQC